MTTIPATVSRSSFDFRPFGRMFWKEYRQQRTLWVGVLVSGVCLQLIARIAISVLLVPEFQPHQAIFVLYLIPLYLPPFFLAASTAMLFALEREERTSDWLLNLSAPPWPTLLAKSGGAIAGAVSLLLVMWLWAALLSVGSGFEFKSVVNTRTSLVWAASETLGVFSLVGAGFLLWGTLGSLTSRRVVTAVPAALVWWMVLFLVPLISTNYLCWWWTRFSTGGNLDRGTGAIFRGVFVICFLGTAALNVYVGLRWCRGQYLDASWLEELNDRLTAMLPWNRGRFSRVPAAIESEHSGWRTWQRLVWQERQRESLHTGLLVIVCATSLLLALYSLANGEDVITFAVAPLIAALPLVMGVLGFRFDAGGQQLRFLANRGTSPTMIWLAKHVVWLPRAFWIPAVCWAVACLVESAFIPWSGVVWTGPHSSIDQARHPLVMGSFQERGHIFDVLWFVLMSYAVGQAAAMLFRRMILAVGAGLMATIVLVWWQALVAYAPLPRWWAVGGIAVWLMCLTWWYSRHWLIERRNVTVVRRLAVGLILPPMLLLFGSALYRWLEIPGLGPSSPTLMALLYPRESARRAAIVGSDISHDLRPIREAVNAVMQPTTPESLAGRDRLVSVNRSYQLVSQIRSSRELITKVVQDEKRDEIERAVSERFWSVNERALATIMGVLFNELPASYRTQRTVMPYEDATPNPQLLLDAIQLGKWQRGSEEMLRYHMAGLRLTRCFASQTEIRNWVRGREFQAEYLRSLVEWSGRPDVSREMLISAISQTRDELSRFPTLPEASAAEFVLGEGSEKWMRQQLEVADDPASLRFAKKVVATLIPHEFARRARMNEQALFWRWHLYRSVEWSMRTPGINPRQQVDDLIRHLEQTDGGGNELQYATLLTGEPSRFGEGFADTVIGYEAVNRQALLALAIALWKKDHEEEELPHSLEDLAPYCIIDVPKNEPVRAMTENERKNFNDRVLPVMALNNPWTGAKFGYSGARWKGTVPDDIQVLILSSKELSAFGPQNRAVQNATANGIVFASPSTLVGQPNGVMLFYRFDMKEISLLLP